MTLKGAAAGVYYVEDLPSYYLDAAEPAGVWRGWGAQLLGLSGEIDADEFLAVMSGATPDGIALLGRRHGEKSVRGFDVTFSAPKSVSVMFAVGDDAVRSAVLTAHDSAVNAVVDWIEVHAHTRYRINGEVAVVDVEGIAAAVFRQHTSRALDPQVHSHVVIANRVLSDDGRWLALDARTIKVDQRTLSALYHAGLRSELTRRLGVAWLPVINGIADVAGIGDEVLVEFSTRTTAVRSRVETKLHRFAETMGREPTRRERWRLEREAVVDSRPAKPHGHDPAELHDRWRSQVIELGLDPERIITNSIGRVVDRHHLDDHSHVRVSELAIEALSDRQSTWRPAEIVRELAAATPTDTALPAGRLADRLDRLADDLAITAMIDLSVPLRADVRLRRDGRPVTESVASRALTTEAILNEEHDLLVWAQRRLTPEIADAPIAMSEELTVVQAQTAAAVAGKAELVMVVGPAGTGKTTALRPAVQHLQAHCRPVYGLAPSAVAAQVLATETSMAADTIDKLLIEHRPGRTPAVEYDLAAGATVIVDEAGMVATPRLAQLARLADTKGWRVVLVGDPLQFSAVGRGAMFGLLTDTCGAIELDQVHRFVNDWERQASLRLRQGDPTVADLYHLHGRLHGGTQTEMEEQTVAAWWNTRSHGLDAAMMTPTNDTVIVLNQLAQHQRIEAGEVDTTGPAADLGPYKIRIGDEIATRNNNRTLTTNLGHMVRNRAQWTVNAIRHDGALVATSDAGTITLPANYTHQHIELAYAQTSHANQSRTVDHSYLLLDAPTDARGTYVPMSRGRHTNHTYIVTTGDRDATEIFADAITQDWIDQPAHTRHHQLNPTPTPTQPPHPQPTPDLAPLPLPAPIEAPQPLPAPIEAPQPLPAPLPELRPAAELKAILDRYIDIGRTIETIRHDTQRYQRSVADNTHQLDETLDRITDTRALIEQHAQTLAELDRPLRRRRHFTEINRARQQLSHQTNRLAGTEDRLARLQREKQALHADAPAIEHAADQRPHLLDEHQRLQTAIDHDRHTRGHRLTHNPPPLIVETIGPPPTDPNEIAIWERAAGAIAQHRTAHEITDPNTTLGPAPEIWATTSYTITRHTATDAIEELRPNRQPDLTPTPTINIGIEIEI